MPGLTTLVPVWLGFEPVSLGPLVPPVLLFPPLLLFVFPPPFLKPPVLPTDVELVSLVPPVAELFPPLLLFPLLQARHMRKLVDATAARLGCNRLEIEVPILLLR